MKSLSITCNETGEVFKSLTEASNAMGITLPNLSKHLKGHPGRTKVNGYSFSYVDSSIPKYTEEQIKKLVINKREHDRTYWDQKGRDKYSERNSEYKKNWWINGGREKNMAYQNKREATDPSYRMIRRIRKRQRQSRASEPI